MCIYNQTLRTVFNSSGVVAVAGELLYCMQAPMRVSACYYKDMSPVIMYYLKIKVLRDYSIKNIYIYIKYKEESISK
jgi:hypothetical protein